MLSFRQYLEESRTLEIGRNPSHEKYRKSHEDQMHDVIRSSYKELNGYLGLGSGLQLTTHWIDNADHSFGGKEFDVIIQDIKNEKLYLC